MKLYNPAVLCKISFWRMKGKKAEKFKENLHFYRRRTLS
jgi:hypothetical protein